MSSFDCDLDFEEPRGVRNNQYSPTELGKIFGGDEREESMEFKESLVALHRQWFGAGNIPDKSEVEWDLLPARLPGTEQNIAPVHPTAIELVAGIAKAGEEGRIDEWRNNGDSRDVEPVQQPDGAG